MSAMTLKRTLVLLAVLAAPCGAITSTDPFGQFESRERPELLRPFALDLGGLLGSDSAHTGRSLGLPGFWVGAVGGLQSRPDSNDLILRNSGVHTFGLPMVEVEAALPFKIDAIVHGAGIDGASIIGGGLRYGLYRTDLIDLFLPNVSVSALLDKVSASAFSAVHEGFNATATWNLPIIKPFFIAGLDVTNVTVKTSLVPNNGESATATGSRFSAGVELKPLPLIDARIAATLRHNIPGLDLGLGVTF